MKKVRATAIGLIAALGLWAITTPAMALAYTPDYKDEVGEVWIGNHQGGDIGTVESLFGNEVEIISTDPQIDPKSPLQDLTQLDPPVDWQNITVENNGKDTQLNLDGIFRITEETNAAIARILPVRAYLLNHYKWFAGSQLQDIPQRFMINLHFELDRNTSFNDTDLSVPEELALQFTSDKFNACNDGESLEECLKREGALTSDGGLVDPVDAANAEQGTALTQEVSVKPKLENGKVTLDLMAHLSMAKLQKLNPQYGKYDGNKNWDFDDPNGPEQNPTFNPGSKYISVKPKIPFKILGERQRKPHYEYSGSVKFDNSEVEQKINALLKNLNPFAGSETPSPEEVHSAFAIYQSSHDGSIPFLGKKDLFLKDGEKGGPWAEAYQSMYEGFTNIYGTGFNDETFNVVNPLQIGFQAQPPSISTQALAYTFPEEKEDKENKATGDAHEDTTPGNTAALDKESRENTSDKNTVEFISDLNKFNSAECTGTVYVLADENSREDTTRRTATCKEAWYAFSDKDKEAAAKAVSLGKTLISSVKEADLKDLTVQDVVALRGLDKSKKYLLVSKLVDQDGNAVDVKEVLTPIENLDSGQKIVEVAIPAKVLQNKQLEKLIFLTYLYEGENIQEDKLLLKSDNLKNEAETIEVAPLPDESPTPPTPDPDPKPEPKPDPIPDPQPKPNPMPIPDPQPNQPQPNQPVQNTPVQVNNPAPANPSQVLEETGSVAEEVLFLALLALLGGGTVLVIAKRKAQR